MNKDVTPFFSLTESKFVDDPNTRIKILAENRYPNMSPQEREAKYKLHNDEIIHQAPNGQWYKTEPDGFFQGVKQFAADTVGKSPTIIGSAVGGLLGAVGGPGGIAAGGATGAAVGEAARSGIGNMVYDEPQTVASETRDILLEGMMGGIGSVGGIGANRFANRGVAKDIHKFTQNKAQVDALVEKSNQVDIPLTPGEATGLRSLSNKQALLRDLPGADDRIDDFLVNRQNKIEGAINKQMDDISNVDAPDTASVKALDSLEVQRAQMLKKRMQAEQLHYEAAADDQLMYQASLQS